MRKLVFLVLLTGCATDAQLERQRQERAEQQSTREALIAYYISQCRQQGINQNDEQAMKGCVMVMHQRRVLEVMGAAAAMPRRPNVLEEMGNAIRPPEPRPQQNCTTRPDYMGGWITNCY